MPCILYNHSEDINKRPKADIGLRKAGSYAVLQETGLFLAVGSGLYSLIYKHQHCCFS